jgi:hypothetical protein
MKQQVSRLSPHQNGKVIAALMTISSMVFLVPMMLIMSFVVPAGSRPPMFMVIVMPVFYFVFGYIMVAVGCAAYNFLFQYVGGIEFESKSDGA